MSDPLAHEKHIPWDITGISQELTIFSGYDNPELDYDPKLASPHAWDQDRIFKSKDERIALAESMIERWKLYITLVNMEPD